MKVNNIKNELIHELYPEYVQIIGQEGLVKAINSPETLIYKNEIDQGLPFELSVVFTSIKLVISLVDTIMKVLSYKSQEEEQLYLFKEKIMNSLVEKMTPEELLRALGSKSIDEVIATVNSKMD